MKYTDAVELIKAFENSLEAETRDVKFDDREHFLKECFKSALATALYYKDVEETKKFLLNYPVRLGEAFRK